MVGRIRFHIDADGEVQVSVEGVTGTKCEALTEPFEKALGTVAQREHKDSYYQTEEAQAGLHAEGGSL